VEVLRRPELSLAVLVLPELALGPVVALGRVPDRTVGVAEIVADERRQKALHVLRVVIASRQLKTSLVHEQVPLLLLVEAVVAALVESASDRLSRVLEHQERYESRYQLLSVGPVHQSVSFWYAGRLFSSVLVLKLEASIQLSSGA